MSTADKVCGGIQYKFPYQKQEHDFIDTYYSPYLDVRARTQNQRTSFVSAYLRDSAMQHTQHSKAAASIIAQYLGLNFHTMDSDLYRSECENIVAMFKRFRSEYMHIQDLNTQPAVPRVDPIVQIPISQYLALQDKIRTYEFILEQMRKLSNNQNSNLLAPHVETRPPAPSPIRPILRQLNRMDTVNLCLPSISPLDIEQEALKKASLADSMNEWEAKYEENALNVDGIHIFDNPGSGDGYFDYELTENMNLCPQGATMIIAPNKKEYILPGDVVFCYSLHGASRKRRPRNRWYFWTDIESFDVMQRSASPPPPDPCGDALF